MADEMDVRQTCEQAQDNAVAELVKVADELMELAARLAEDIRGVATKIKLSAELLRGMSNGD